MTSFYHCPPIISLKLRVHFDFEELRAQLEEDLGDAPEEVAKRGWRGMAGMMDLLVGLPKDFRRLLRAARRGALRVRIDIAELERFGERLDRAASRLTIGMITAAFIIGTSIMMSVSGDTEYLGMTILASFGFAMATLGGVWVLVSIWRGRR